MKSVSRAKSGERGTLTSCKYGHVGESDIHLGKIEPIGIGEDEGVSVVSCPRVDNRGSGSHGCEEVKELDICKHIEVLRNECE